MVQREVADRFFAQPRTKAYGAVLGARAALGAQDRLPPCSSDGVPPATTGRVGSRRLRARRPSRRSPRSRPTVEAAFAHRRKTLANSVALSGLAIARAGGGGAQRQSGRRRTCGPRSSSPRTSSSPRQMPSDEPRAGVREDQPGSRRRPAATTTGKHEVVDRPAADRPPRRHLARAADEHGRRRVRGGHHRAGRAGGAGDRCRGRARSGTCHIEKRIPGGCRARRRKHRCGRGALDLANADARCSHSRPTSSTASPRALGADVPVLPAWRHAARRRGDGTELERIELPLDYRDRDRSPRRCGEGVDERPSTSSSTPAGSAPAMHANRAAALTQELEATHELATWRGCLRTTSRPRRSHPRSCAAGAFRADVVRRGALRCTGLFESERRIAEPRSAARARRPNLRRAPGRVRRSPVSGKMTVRLWGVAKW